VLKSFILFVFFRKRANPQDSRTQVSRKTLPHVVYCRIWRFSDLQNSNELKALPCCKHGYHHHSSAAKKAADESYVCINPYHYMRVDAPTHTQSNSQANPLTVYVPKPSLSQTNCIDGVNKAADTTLINNTNGVFPNMLPMSDANQQHLQNSQLPNSSSSSSSTTPTSQNGTSSSSANPNINNTGLGDLPQHLATLTGDLMQGSGNNFVVGSPSSASIKSPSSIGMLFKKSNIHELT
jgi:hypothetical protein